MTKSGDLAAANIRFVDALVVYKEDLEGTYHYIVREDGMAIDLLNTTLNLDLGATISGNIVMDVAYEDGFFLTSSLRHPKILIKEFSYFLMPCHQHGLRINLLV